ncbi:MAG TPA: hypothetical protein DIW47_06880 [Bacteroidetes bacterium]|nr:hypothetical protein [Bacteroidota bacterium]
MQAPYNEITIQSLLRKLRIFNREIGEYELFAITENFDYVVKLSNGKILITIEELQEDEKDALTTESLVVIAKRFVPSGQTMTAPPQAAVETEVSQGPAVKTTIFWTILAAGLVIMLILGGLGYVDVVNKQAKPIARKTVETYKEKVMTIGEIERAKPLQFLLLRSDYKKNFWGTKIRLQCSVKNTATVVSYKDVKLQVTHYSDTKAILGTREYILFDNFPSQSEKELELKIENLKHTDSISCKILSAKVD